MTLQKYPRKIEFCVLAGVEHPKLAGDEIVGRWQNDLRVIHGSEKRLAEDFANHANRPEDILKFTRKYGPLEGKARPGAEFRFKIKDWIFWQESIRGQWKALVASREKGNENVELILGSYDDTGGDSFQLAKGVLTYRAPNLNRYLFLDLYSLPVQYLRVCKREDCPNPYFVAMDLREQYCSRPCKIWARSNWKRKWWEERGKQWRASRSSKKGDKKRHGTPKTR